MQTGTDSPTALNARRDSVRRSLGWRVVAVLALVAFVVLVGDLRRRRTAMSQIGDYASSLAAQIGTTGVVPLNLNPRDLLGADHLPIDMSTLTRAEVGCLREQSVPMMLAWSVRLIQVLGRNGRAIVTYENHSVEPVWITERDYHARFDEQTALLAGCR